MPQIDSNKRKPATAALLVLLAALALAACGGTSTGSTSSTAVASTNPATRGAASSRFAKLRECMQQNGVTLPKFTPGKGRPPSGGGFFGGRGAAPALPAGVTRAQYQAAIKKCGPIGGRAGGAAGLRNFSTPAAKAAFAAFAACMRKNGIDIPPANTSGNGPIFNTKGLNPGSAEFTAAQMKCAGVLRGAFRAQPGAAAGSPGSAPAPGAAGASG
jgi:hypothetical protein